MYMGTVNDANIHCTLNGVFSPEAAGLLLKSFKLWIQDNLKDKNLC